jgi:hypothetical protein
MIFEISFENQAAPARDFSETNFKRTKSHLALSRNKISDHHNVYSYLGRRVQGVISKIICLVVNIYSSWQTDVPQYWSILNFLLVPVPIRSFMNARKAARGIEWPKLNRYRNVFVNQNS